MDAIGKLNNKGAALVFIAVGLVVLLALAGLAIDLGYMYVAKGQLQSAADAAALAGAGRLDGTASFAQYSARHAAVRFAQKNTAAGESVAISSDYSNSQSSSNDVTVGNWNGITKTYTVGGTPVNAVEVRTRRTGTANEVEGQASGASIGGPISLFFGKTFGFPKMGASASAVAARVPRAGTYIMIGRNTCGTAMPLSLAPTSNNMAWTTYEETTTATSAIDVKNNYFCPRDKVPDAPVCGRSLYTTGGTDNTVFQSVELDFYDPVYDEAHKTFTTDAQGNRVVATWTVIVPIAREADPTAQPSPMPVWGYARIRMIRACGSGGGNPCGNEITTFRAPSGTCSSGEADVVIDEIECASCENSTTLFGARPGLVQ